MLLVNVFFAELLKSFTIFRRYIFGSVITILVMILIFIGIFETTISLSPVKDIPNDTTRLIVQKFALWTVMILGFSGVAGTIKDETQSGFIEVVWMGTLHPSLVVLIRSLISHLISAAICMTIALILSFTYDVADFFSPRYLLAVLNITVVSVGFSMIFGAGLIIFKDTGPLVSLFQFILLPIFLAFEPDTGGALLILPGFSALTLIVAPYPDIIRLLAFQLSPVLWFVIGYACFYFSVQHSRRLGTIYEY